DAEQIAPQTIDVALGEVGVVLGRDPQSELFATTERGRRKSTEFVGKSRLGDCPCTVALYFARALVVDNFDERRRAIDVGAADFLILEMRIRLPADLGEERCQLVVLILGPSLERMVVALVAVKAHGQEKLSSVLHNGAWLAEDLEVRSGRIVER